MQHRFTRGDEGLTSHVGEFIGRPSPPRLLLANGRGLKLGLRGDGPQQIFGGGLAAVAVDTNVEHVMVVALVEPPAICTCELGAADRRTLHGMDEPATCVWLSLLADRVAAGSATGSIYIWSYCAGDLLATCVAHIMESTRWTTVGHFSEVNYLTSAPAVGDAGSQQNVHLVQRARESFLVSADRHGTVCLWGDGGLPVMCENAKFAAARLEDSPGDAVGLATGNGLVVCFFPWLAVGFDVPWGNVLFILSTVGEGNPRASIGSLAALILPTEPPPDEDPGVPGRRRAILAATGKGAILKWEVEDCRSPAERVRGELPPCRGARVLVGPWDKPHGRSVVAVGAGELCWFAEAGGALQVRWLDVEGQAWDSVRAGGELPLWPPILAAQVPHHAGFLPSAAIALPRHFRWPQDRAE